MELLTENITYYLIKNYVDKNKYMWNSINT